MCSCWFTVRQKLNVCLSKTKSKWYRGRYQVFGSQRNFQKWNILTFSCISGEKRQFLRYFSLNSLPPPLSLTLLIRFKIRKAFSRKFYISLPKNLKWESFKHQISSQTSYKYTTNYKNLLNSEFHTKLLRIHTQKHMLLNFVVNNKHTELYQD